MNSWYGQYGWRWMFGLTAVPVAAFLRRDVLCARRARAGWPRTARRDQARGILARIGGASLCRRRPGGHRSDTRQDESQQGALRAICSIRRCGKVLVLGVVLAVFQQWCGINVIFQLRRGDLPAAGYDISSVLNNIAWTGSVNLVFTFVALGVVDRGGRRPLMLFGAAGLAVIYVVMGCVTMLTGDRPADAAAGPGRDRLLRLSLAPVTWVVISEIFPNRIRGAAMSVAVSSVDRLFHFDFYVPMVNKKLGPAGPSGSTAGICIAGFSFILWRLPETKGKTLEEIERELVD